MLLELNNVTINIDGNNIVKNIDITIPDGKFVGLIGLNGTGKSTLLKAVYGINNYDGEIFLNGENIQNIILKEFAQKISVLIQENSTDFDFKVKDIVLLGRLPYKNLFDVDTAKDYDIVHNSLKYLNMEEFEDRYFNTLSGGEKQRVLIARILAQQTDFLILDEPTNHLDIKNQFQFFEIIKNLHFTVFAVLHDLNIAAKFCDYIYVLKDGGIYQEGIPEEVFNKQMLYDVFGMHSEIHRTYDNKVYIEYITTV